jgi:leucyl-tRNA synthetase
MTQGMVCHETYRNGQNQYLYPEEIVKHKNSTIQSSNGEVVIVGSSEKMSKSKKNIVSPDSIVEEFGCDTARVFVISNTPPDKDLEWTESGIQGSWKYLSKIWRLFAEVIVPIITKDLSYKNVSNSSNLMKVVHITINNVTQHIENFQLNKYIADLHIITNTIEKEIHKKTTSIKDINKSAKNLLILLNPIAPHISEELWQIIGEKGTVGEHGWPNVENLSVEQESTKIIIQINGKVKDTFSTSEKSSQHVKHKSIKKSKIRGILQNAKVKRIIYTNNKVLNIVI